MSSRGCRVGSSSSHAVSRSLIRVVAPLWSPARTCASASAAMVRNFVISAGGKLAVADCPGVSVAVTGDTPDSFSLAVAVAWGCPAAHTSRVPVATATTA